MIKIYTKATLISKSKAIRKRGWIENARPGNVGGVGNTVEDILGIVENNLPIPNASEWELKCQRMDSGSLTTLFHTEPSPRALKIVPNILLPKYGWKHEEAGKRYPANEKSFRQTINCVSRSDRGFKVIVNRKEKKVLISFDASRVATKHRQWLQKVKHNIGLKELNPQPYWGFEDLFHKAGTKLPNCFFLEAKSKTENGKEYFFYEKIYLLKGFSLDKFIKAIERGTILVDFDARTGHNHGTKFRMRQGALPELYKTVKII